MFQALKIFLSPTDEHKYMSLGTGGTNQERP